MKRIPMNNNRHKICIVATVPFALHVFMRAHIAMLADSYDVTLIAGGSRDDMLTLSGDHIKTHHVDFSRKISLLSDLCCLVILFRIFWREKFDVVHSIMPKTGLLAMVAAWLACRPHRIHSFTGQVWANKTGFGRMFLQWMDRIIVFCSTHLLTDSFSQRDFLLQQKIGSTGKITVLGKGSVCGVDINRFKFNPEVRVRYRTELAIPMDAVVFMFLGRVNRDKGVNDLARAFVSVNNKVNNVYLLMVGPDEDNLESELRSILAPCLAQYRRIGYTDQPEDFMSCSDILCLPSYREGFGSVIIEAASTGLPAVASNIVGVTDAVVDGETGILHEPGHLGQIEAALLLLATNKKLHRTMSDKAKFRAHAFFNQHYVVSEMAKFYENIVKPLPVH